MFQTETIEPLRRDVSQRYPLYTRGEGAWHCREVVLIHDDEVVLVIHQLFKPASQPSFAPRAFEGLRSRLHSWARLVTDENDHCQACLQCLYVLS